MHFATFLEGLASAATVIGVAVAAVTFGRRITVDLTAEVHMNAHGCFIAARPRAKCIGLRGVGLSRPESANLCVDEVRAKDDGGVELHAVQPGFRVFKDQTFHTGEELVTDKLLPVHMPTEDLLGWRVVFILKSKTWRFKEIEWSSEVIVPKP